MPTSASCSTPAIQANTIAQALDIDDLYLCFQRIKQGTASFTDYDLVEHLWHLPTEWQQLLESADLPTALDTPTQNLSEGQKTKLALSFIPIERSLSASG
jgi:ATPase subunit of ABC transporter with duplicated ATPase domains